MALGCPVVVSDRSCLPEICSDAALYASPTDPNAWLERFSRLRDDPALRATLVERGLRRAALYSWSASAESYLEMMARSDGLIPPSPECLGPERSISAISNAAEAATSPRAWRQ
jgi:hypothetical protein